MIALVDADVLAFRCSASSEQEPEEEAILRLDKWCRSLLADLDAPAYQMFLTGKNNFRYTLYSEYKANRKDKPKPRHLEACRKFLISEWKAEVSDGCEADDLLGIHHTEGQTIICSYDKDLLQIPGQHYNLVTREILEVGHYEGMYNFWTQMLMGDRSDNVPGFDGVSRAKLPKFIETMLKEMLNFEQDIFMVYEDKTQFFINYNLLHIWRKENDFQCPQVIRKLLTGQNHLKLDETLTLESFLSIKNCLNQLSENGQMVVETGSFVPGTQTEDI